MSGIGRGFSTGRRRLAALTCVVALSAFALGSGPASAAGATRHVSPAGADTANDCLVSTSPCATIQYAIDAAIAGDTVQVGAGTYAENLTVPKTLTLRGPNAEIDPNTGARGAEAVIDGGNGTAIAPQAAGIVIDGFTVSTTTAGAPIFTSGADTDGLTISDNITGSGVAAVRLEAGGENITVEHNRIAGKGYDVFLDGDAYTDLAIKDNFVLGPVDFYGIFNAGGATIEGFDLSGNTIEATSNIGADVSHGIVTENLFDVDAPGAMNLQIALHESEVLGNSFEGNGTTGCLQLFGSQFGLVPSKEVLVANNSFHACNAYGVQLSPDIEAIEITGNSITDSYDGVNTRSITSWDLTGLGIQVVANRITGSTHMGVDNTVDGTLDAQDNWWGCNAGPGAPGCDPVGANVDASPHVVLTGSASAAQIAPAQSTTVTARLDTDSDGAFVVGVPGSVSFTSALGSLSPAIAPLVDGTASSTFTAGAQAGPAAIAVGLDGEQVSVPLTIVAPPALLPIEAPPASPPTIDVPDKPIVVEGKTPVLGTLTCATACQVEPKSAAAKIGGKTFKLKVKVPAKIAAGDSARIKVVLPKAVRKALADGKVGTVRVTVTLTDANGEETTRTIRVRIKRPGGGSRSPSS